MSRICVDSIHPNKPKIRAVVKVKSEFNVFGPIGGNR